MYTGATTGVTTNEGQHAFFINENGLPAVKSGSQTIVFSTSGSAFTGSSGSSGSNGSKGSSGSSGVSGTSGQDGAPGDIGAAGSNGTNGSSGASGINGVGGAAGSSGANGSSGSSGQTYGTSGSSGATGSSGSSGANGSSGSSGSNGSAGGYSQWTPIVTDGITASVNSTFTRTNVGGAWNQGFASEQGFEVAYVSANPISANNRCVIGLNSDPATDASYTTLDYCIGITVSGGTPTIYESNTLVYTHPTGITTDTLFTITYDGYNVKYYIDSTLVHTTARALSGLLYLDSSLFTGGGGSGFTNVVFGPYSLAGASGTSGSSGATGASGSSGSSGTSAGGGGGDTLQTQQIGVAASQPSITGSAVQWRAIYGDGNNLDQGSGGQYDTVEYGFIQPLFLEAGETIEKVGFYFMDYASSGTAAFKVIICDKHPDAYLPWNLLHTEELTFTQDDVDNKFISWDYDFTNTGSTRNTYFVYILFSAQTTRTFELCRTVQSPQYLVQDTRLITSSNRYDNNSHWVTAYHSIYSSLPSTMSSIIANNLYYNNQRGAHMYYQTSRP